MRKPTIDTSAQLRAEASARKAREEADNLRRNMAQDLTSENITNIVAGGGADEFSGDLRKKKANVPGLATQLGLNV